MGLNPFNTEAGRLSARIQTTRRHFLGMIGAIVAGGTAIFGGFMSLKFLFPTATLEEPLRFRTSQDATLIQPGEHFRITSKRVEIIRDDGGFYAVFMVCTHLGCTPNYSSDVVSDLLSTDPGIQKRALDAGERKPSERQPNGWKCPCHGSRYFIDSTNFYGPAPRPMDWVDLAWTPDKSGFVVDRGKLVAMRGAGDTTPVKWRLSATPGGASNGKTVGV